MKTVYIYPVGKTVFLVHKNYLTVKNRVIVPCKVKTYESHTDEIITVCAPIGDSKKRYTSNEYLIHHRIEDAVLCLSKSIIRVNVLQ